MSNSSQEQSNSIFKPMQNNIWTAQILPNESIVSQIERQNAQRQKLVERTIACPTHKTLCWALNELAKYENQKGTEEFCDYVIGFSKGGYIGIRLDLNHHGVENDKRPNFKGAELTDFITLDFPKLQYVLFSIDLGITVEEPTFPLYVDIEYVEMGYALYKKYMGGAFYAYFGWNFGKLVAYLFTGKGNHFGYPPNKYGFVLGVYIAKNFNTIQSFVHQWCVGEVCKL